jgi:hypothetical protein
VPNDVTRMQQFEQNVPVMMPVSYGVIAMKRGKAETFWLLAEAEGAKLPGLTSAQFAPFAPAFGRCASKVGACVSPPRASSSSRILPSGGTDAALTSASEALVFSPVPCLWREGGHW